IAIIIASSQLKDFFGFSGAALPAEFIPKLAALWAVRGTFNATALLIGIAALILIVLLRRLFPRFPGLIVAMTVVSAAVALGHLPVDTIASRYGALPGHLPMPAVPAVSLERLGDLLPSALVIAFLAAIESLLSAMVADRMIEGSHRPNAEVIAQGWANIASALFGGLPATGAIARTATNIRAGATTPVAGLVHAIVILLVLLVAAPLAGFLAMPALAALLLTTAWNMSEPHKWRSYWAAPAGDRLLLLITLVLTVLSDLTVAIGVGVALGLALRLRDRQLEADRWRTPER
ncbi:MAG TPA: SulP family inorganic anion transporter, partial [Novosphingobium sp.]|nr:SulP family inorganic anion transporter [Novosphingobium sp.]